jgi:ATP adenylyltransferase
MTFEELKDFILNKMKMSHIYQPLLIKTLLEYGGTSTIKQMAISFLAKDESQIAYYEKIIKNMPVKVLEKHGVLKKDNDLIKLNIKPVTLQQKVEISKLCESKIQEYIVSRGFSIWNHRLYDQDAISDILRYRVLKEAKGRCSLCGVTSKEAMLDIDHIIPRSKGGKTVYENLQVLCAKCNRSKSNKDDYDFRDLGLVSEKIECSFIKDWK